MQSIRRSVPASFALVALLPLLLTACGTPPQAPQPQPSQQPDVVMPPPVGPVALPAPAPTPVPPMTPVSFDALPGWQQDDLFQACRILYAMGQVCLLCGQERPSSGYGWRQRAHLYNHL